MISLVFAATLLAAGAPPAGETAPAKSEQAAKTNKDGLVCKKEAVVGSRMKTRVCLTQAEWDQRRADSQSELDQAQRNRPFNAN